MNTINYVIKVTQAQVFAVSTKIWQMRLVEQLAVWHVPLFKVCTDSRKLMSLYYKYGFQAGKAYSRWGLTSETESG